MKFKKQQSIKGLRIIIVGCGKVGRTLTEQLSLEGHDITLIDHRSSRIQEMTNQFDVMGIVGNGASYSIQKEAGIKDADLIIAVTDSDELNLLCCTIATQVGNCAAIARVRTPDYSQEVGYLREKLGLAMIINPELEAAREAGIESTEAFVPLTGIDEENILLTLHAKQVSNAKVITKINRISFTDVINQLDLGSVIYPNWQ